MWSYTLHELQPNPYTAFFRPFFPSFSLSLAVCVSPETFFHLLSHCELKVYNSRDMMYTQKWLFVKHKQASDWVRNNDVENEKRKANSLDGNFVRFIFEEMLSSGVVINSGSFLWISWKFRVIGTCVFRTFYDFRTSRTL